MLEVATSVPGAAVGSALAGAIAEGPVPSSITVDHGTDFMSRALEDWAYGRRVQLDFIRPGTPVENAFIESFNARLRDECVNVHQFTSIEHAKMEIEAWRVDYNQRRPHSSGHLTPSEYMARRQGSTGRSSRHFLVLECLVVGPTSLAGRSLHDSQNQVSVVVEGDDESH